MKVLSVHMCLEVSNYQNSLKFYSTLFDSAGFSAGWGDGKSYGSYINGTFTVAIGESQPRRVTRQSPTGKEFVVTDHLGFSVENRSDVDVIAGAMQKAGFEALFPAKEYPEFGGDFYAVTFCDQDNNVLEFCHRSQPVKIPKTTE